MSPPTDVSGVRSSRDATIDAIVLALGLQIQAMLAERKAVEHVLGCDADETVLDAATRVAGDLANAEKQIDDVRDVLKAKVGELTVDAATHAIILAQSHATMVKQVEQMERLVHEQAKTYQTCWHEMGVTLGCMLMTALLLPSRNGDTEFRSWDVPGGPELMLEAARRVVKERDEARRDLASAREDWQAVRNILKPVAAGESVVGAADRVVRERDAYRIRVNDLESDVCKLSAERDEAKALGVTLAKERDDARALCVAVAAELYALPDEPVLAAAKRVAQDLRDEVGEARKARRDRDQALAELNAVRRILSPMNDHETTVEAAKRVVERRDEARSDAGRLRKELDDVRTALCAKSSATTVEAAKRVVMERDAAQASSRRFADVVRGVSATLGAREDEDAVAAAKRVVKERHDLRDELDKRMSL